MAESTLNLFLPPLFEQYWRNGENMKSEKSENRNFKFLTGGINYFPWNVETTGDDESLKEDHEAELWK